MLEKINEEIKELAENASKSVVAILTREIALDEFLSPAVREGIGSGFSVLENHFLTSYHVIRNSREILLIDKEGNIESAQVVATNPFYDLALLKSDLSIPPLKISTSYSLGEMVFAIGNPLGLRSITLGVISGTGRTIVSPSGEALYVLQTDAAVNPGNSGGPLVNIKGEAIGIVTAMIPFAQGIGFAIPAELLQGLLNSYIRFGRYIRPFLGLVVMAINKAIAAYYGLSRSEGLLVVRVSPRSPAKLAIMQGDIIIEADGRKVNNPIELQVALESKGFGNEIELLVDRMGKTFKVRTKIAGYEI
jgi:S1-C subfamily serine protease